MHGGSWCSSSCHRRFGRRSATSRAADDRSQGISRSPRETARAWIIYIIGGCSRLRASHGGLDTAGVGRYTRRKHGCSRPPASSRRRWCRVRQSSQSILTGLENFIVTNFHRMRAPADVVPHAAFLWAHVRDQPVMVSERRSGDFTMLSSRRSASCTRLLRSRARGRIPSSSSISSGSTRHHGFYIMVLAVDGRRSESSQRQPKKVFATSSSRSRAWRASPPSDFS